MNHGWLHLVPLVAMLISASITDLRGRRIPNWLSLGLLVTGILQSMMPGHPLSIGASLAGMAAGFCIPFVLFAMGALGGGDVKLLTAVGAWLGPWPALAVFAGSAVVGMVIVLIQAICLGRLRTLVRNSALVAMNVGHVRQLGMDHVKATGQSCQSVDKPLPYAVPILISTVLVIVTMFHGIRL